MILRSIKNKYKSWSDRRFLKKHGCENWKQYQYLFDQRVDKRATNVRNYYFGYPHVYIFNRPHLIYEWDIWFNGENEVVGWVNQHCQNGFRFDALRVTPQQGIGLDGRSETNWFIDEMGGGDFIFVAFADSKDYTMFLLKWT